MKVVKSTPVSEVIKSIEETEGEGLHSFLDRLIAVHCANYIYCGTLVGVNETCIKLADDAVVVYETGPLTDRKWKDAQPTGKEQYIMIALIERFEEGK